MNHYSEYEEQEYIIQAVAGIERGRFLDVGAFDGETYSNTMALVEMGWSGIMVEPALAACTKLLARHGDSDRVTIVHAVVGPEKGLTQFWNNPHTYSTSVQGRYFGSHPFSAPYLTPMVTFKELEGIAGRFDVVSIDAEGTSVDLLIDFMGRALRVPELLPRCICVEHDERRGEVRDVLTRAYHLIYANQVNMVWKFGQPA